MSNPSLYKYFGDKPDAPSYLEVLFSDLELSLMDAAVQNQISVLLQDISFPNVPSNAQWEEWENLENVPPSCRLNSIALDPEKVLADCPTYNLAKFVDACKLLAFTFKITKAKYDTIATLLASPPADLAARIQQDLNK